MKNNDSESIITSEILMSKIFLLRNQKVMLDRDLAELYGVKSIRLREQVKRNIVRFPTNFMFQLNEKEIDFMVSQNAIPSKQYLGGSNPFAFTEHGILMLANVLKNEKAIIISIQIIELFIQMREMMLTHKDLLLKMNELENKIGNHDKSIQQLFVYLKQLIHQENEPRKKIGFKS